MKWVNRLFHRRPCRPFDLVVLWDWEFDDDFVHALLAGAHHRRLSARAFRPAELTTFINLCRNSNFLPPLIIDRASDVHAFLLPVLTELRHNGSLLINDPQQMIWCRDKATMHLELVNQGIPVPYGIILSQQDQLELVLDRAREKLGSPFVVKPAEGGGGEGVMLEAYSSEHLRKALAESKCGKVILQNRIQPRVIGSRRAWFRVFFVMGEIIPCWWDDLSHIYNMIEPLPLRYAAQIIEIVQQIARISRMQFFSTEITVTDHDELFVIDFVNEMCDMRLQSRHVDGVPDPLFNRIVELLLTRSGILA